jgi:methylglutaconyl-CoA hydratase
MAFKTIKLEFEGEIATITLNRPKKRNAISTEMIEELPRALDEVEKGPARVAILTGAGNAFCAGMDLDEQRNLSSLTHEQHLAATRRIAEMFRSVYTFPKPLVSAVNGAAIAGGAGLATLADLTLAVPEAQFGYTEVRIGFIPAIVSVFLRRQVGEKRTRELLLTGRIFDAAEGHRLGLVTNIVPLEQLLDAARHRCAELCALSPSSLARTKRLLREAERAELERDLEAAIRESAEIRLTHDYREGMAAFLEKRKPEWKGE